MMRKTAVAWGTRIALAAAAACQDATAIVGHVHVAAPDASLPQVSEAGSSGAASTQPMQPLPTSHPKQAQQPKQPRPELAIERGTRDQFCAGHGGAVMRAGSCTRIEHEVFRYALCTCSDLRLDGESFNLDAYDSNEGAYKPEQGGAAVGVNGMLYPSAPEIHIAGSLTVTGSGVLSIAGRDFGVRGDLKSSAPLAVTSSGVRIARDAWFGADVMGPAPSSIVVGRDAYLKPGVMGAEPVQGNAQTADFSVTPPCACDQASALDVPAIVDMAHALADNDAAGFPKDSLQNIVATTIIPVPCGRLVLSELSVVFSTLTIVVTGRTALFVEGDMLVNSSTFGLMISPGAELDLFVAGKISLVGTNALGLISQPSAVRIYAGGTVTSVPNLTLSAALYAPHAQISNPIMEAYGAIVADAITTSGKTAIHYDRSILDTASGCANGAQACDSCEQCAGGLACIAGSCSPCSDDSDCCEPLSCVSGRCGPLNLPAP